MRWLVAVVVVLAFALTVEGKSKISRIRQSLTARSDVTVDASVTENARGEWHVYSDKITQTAHEGIAAAAMAAAGASKFDAEGLRTGVIWNDMPSGYELDEAAMIRDGHMDVDTWTRLFFTTGGINDLFFNVHYGCMQHFHSMAPIQRRQAKANAGSRIVFSNADVRTFIIGQLKLWWDEAKLQPANKKRASWYLGHILHALQDSYPRGHVVRDSTTTTCGNVILFQGYDAQHGNGAHKKADYTPSNSGKESDPTLAKRYACAVQYSTKMLENFAACAAAGGAGVLCNFDATVKPWLLSDVYNMDATAKLRTAGGSHSEFAKSDIAAAGSGFAAETGVSLGGGRTITLYNPTSTLKWKQQSGVRLCDGTGAIQSKAPTTTLGIKSYKEKDFKQFVNFAPTDS